MSNNNRGEDKENDKLNRVLSLVEQIKQEAPEEFRAMAIEIQATDYFRKVIFAKALGSHLGRCVNEQMGAVQPEWAPMIDKAGLLFRKAGAGVWEPGVFFVYNGFLASCSIYPGGRQRVELSTLNLDVALTPLYGGNPMPLPLKGCSIFAAEGVREFQVQVQVPNSGSLMAIDLAAENPEVREQWIEEIFKAAEVGHGFGGRGQYVPKRLRGKKPKEIEAASKVKKQKEASSWTQAMKEAAGKFKVQADVESSGSNAASSGGGNPSRACANLGDGAGCALM